MESAYAKGDGVGLQAPRVVVSRLSLERDQGARCVGETLEMELQQMADALRVAELA